VFSAHLRISSADAFARKKNRVEPRAARPYLHPMTRTARVIANGEETPVNLPMTLEEFLRSRGLPPRSVVVEQNGEAVAPSQFAERPIGDGDRLEIVRIVAGG
jgi:sulfur carrier protein